jgi:hypothetical protein
MKEAECEASTKLLGFGSQDNEPVLGFGMARWIDGDLKLSS